MAEKKPLWVAPEPPEPDANPEPVTNRPGSLSAAADLGRLEQLIALRDRLAKIIDNDASLARDVASLSIRYMATIKEIDELKAIKAAEGADEVGSAAQTPDTKWEPI